MKNLTTFYLCNGKNPYCKCKNGCGVIHPNDIEVCFHTTNPEYAIYGSDLSKLDRPIFVKDDDGNIWEGFIGYGKLDLLEKLLTKEENNG